MERTSGGRLCPQQTHAFLNELLGDDVHATRVLSLANGVVGIMHAASLGIHAIGRGLADALDLEPQHAIKQVDRLLSNRGIVIWEWFAQWCAFVVADRKELLVALDWTELDKDGEATIALYVINSHGRATPLIRKTIGSPERRDRLLFMTAVAQALLTLLGQAGEDCGLDRTLKANTVKRRTMSIFNQGVYWYGRIPNMRDERLRPLMEAFARRLAEQTAFKQLC